MCQARHLQRELLQDAGETMGISIGAARFPEDSQNYGELFRSADEALYTAKKLGKNQYCIYGK